MKWTLCAPLNLYSDELSDNFWVNWNSHWH